MTVHLKMNNLPSCDLSPVIIVYKVMDFSYKNTSLQKAFINPITFMMN